MANEPISNLKELTEAVSADEFVVVDDSNSETKKITFANLVGGATKSELAFMSGVTSAVQTQLDSKADVGQTFYIGTTQVAINRASNPLTLAGITLTDLTMEGNIVMGDNLTFTTGTSATLNSVDAQIIVARNVNDDITGNGHAFSDSSDITRAGTIGYNSFDARIDFEGTNNYNHYAGFQVAPTYNSTGTMTNNYGLVSNLAINSGTITNSYGVKIFNPTGAGTLINNYGLYIASLNKGTTSNYAIYTETGTIHFGDNIEFDTTARTIAGIANGNLVDKSASNIFTNTSGQKFKYDDNIFTDINFFIRSYRYNDTAYFYQSFYRARGSYASPTAVASADIIGTINFFGYVGAVDKFKASTQIISEIDGAVADNPYTIPGRLIFKTTGTDTDATPSERMRIDSAGYVNIANGATIGSTTYTANSLLDDATHGDGSTTMYIGNSTIDVTAPSDIATKKDIKDTKYSLNDLMKIKVIDFKYKNEFEKEDIQHSGMIAQDLEKIYPEAVTKRSDGYLAINYKTLTPLLIKSVQELLGKIELLEKNNK